MSAHPDPHTSVKEMLRRIRFNIFERLEKGNFRYERDMGTLRKHLEIAQEMGDPITISAMHNAIGLVDARLGNMQQAEQQFLQGYAVVRGSQEDSLMGTLQNNLGEIYRRQGKHAQAISAYQQARAHYEKAQNLSGLMTVESNLGFVSLATEDYDRAEYHFQHVLNTTIEAPWDFLETIIETRNGIAEIHLHSGRYDQAWKQVNEAERLAQGGTFTVLLAQTHLTKAHIAERDPRHTENKHHYYRLARQGLQQHGTAVILARALLDEAHYQQRRGNPQDALRLAVEAGDLFDSLHMGEDAALARALLRTVSAASG